MTIQQGDAFKLLPQLKGDTASAAVVDYPWSFVNEERPGRASHENDEDWDMADNADIYSVLEHIARIVNSGGYVFIFADDDVLPQFRKAAERHLTYRKTLIWDTERIGNGHYFRSRHSYIICATVGETERYVTSTPTVLQAPAPQREPGETTEYPTEKPARLYRKFLDPVLKEGEKIIEPFCGSAPALEVANSIGCDYWGCDVSDSAIQRANRRAGQQRLNTA
jgi:DNA modification methylase